MPLLNRKIYSDYAPLISNFNAPSSSEGFLIRITGEWVKTYEDYISKLNLYRKRQWSCKYSGKGQMNYEEAAKKEETIQAQLSQFPKDQEESILRAVQHSTKKLDELCSSIYNSLRPAAEPNDGADNAKTDNAVRLAGPSKKAPPQQPKAPISKVLLRAYIVSHAEQTGPEGAQLRIWVVDKKLVKKYKLPEEVPEELKKAQEASIVVRKKKRPSEAAPPSSASKKAKKEDESSPSKKSKNAFKDKDGASSPAAKGEKKKKSKKSSTEGGDEEQATTGDESKSKKKAEKPEKAKKKEIDESMLLPPVPPKPLEEVEAQYKPGSVRTVLVQVMKAVQPEALSVQALIDKAKEMGLREFEEKQKGRIYTVLCSDINFVRVDKGLYSLHAFHPEIVVRPRKPREKPEQVVEEGKEDGSGKSKKSTDDSPLAKAKRLLKQSKATLARHRASLAQAQEAQEEAKRRVALAKKQSSSSGRSSSEVHVPPELLKQFEISEAEREFQGDSDDRKGMLAHRQKIQSKGRELEKEKQKFIKEYLEKLEADAKANKLDLKAEEAALKQATTQVASLMKPIESAEKAVAAAEKQFDDASKRSTREAEKQKEKEAKEREKEARERAKEEAKKYPMEDLELLTLLPSTTTTTTITVAAPSAAAPDAITIARKDVEIPPQLDHEDAARLATSLYVSDFLIQFGRHIGLRAIHLPDLERLLSSHAEEAAGNSITLPLMFQRLQGLLLEDKRAQGEASATEKRWAALLSEGTWPEVLRRMVLSRLAASEHQDSLHQQGRKNTGTSTAAIGPGNHGYRGVDERVALAANMLTFDGAGSLTVDQNLALLRFLADEALESEKMRTLLQKRLDESQDITRDLREEMAEERRRIRELAEAEREERRKKKQEMEEEKEKEKAATAVASEGEAPNMEESQGPSSLLHKESSITNPSFDLPEELREYSGDPDDKKALLLFRQRQQSERRRLEKECNRWLADELRRGRELEAKAKAAREAELAKQKEKESAQEALLRAQQVLEEKLDKYIVRRVPLGFDRHHRRYWWGLAGDWGRLFIEDTQGHWSVISSLEELEALRGSLDKRGIRELALLQALEKNEEGLEHAMRKAMVAQEKAKEKEKEKESKDTDSAAAAAASKSDRPIPARTSARESKQPEFYNPTAASKDQSSKARGRSSANTAASGLTTNINPSECLLGVEWTAARWVFDLVSQVVREAENVGVEAPSESNSWTSWSRSVSAVLRGSKTSAAAVVVGALTHEINDSENDDQTAAGNRSATPGSIRSALQSKLMELEAAIYAASSLARDDDGSSSEEEDDDDTDDESQENDGQTEQGGSNIMSRSQSLCSLDIVEVVDGLFSPSKLPKERSRRLWKTVRERTTWQADVKQAMTMARLCYCAGVLHLQSQGLFNGLRGSQEEQPEKVGPSLGATTATGSKDGGGGKKRKAEGGNEDGLDPATSQAVSRRWKRNGEGLPPLPPPRD